MKTALFTRGLEDLKTEALVIGLYEGVDVEDTEKYNELSEGFIYSLIKDKEFTGKFGRISMLRLKGKIRRLVLVGLGKREEFNLNKAREAAGKSAVYVRENRIKEFCMLLFEDLQPFDVAYSMVEGMKLALYQFTDFKTQGLDEFKKIEQFTLVANGNNFIDIDKA